MDIRAYDGSVTLLLHHHLHYRQQCHDLSHHRNTFPCYLHAIVCIVSVLDNIKEIQLIIIKFI